MKQDNIYIYIYIRKVALATVLASATVGMAFGATNNLGGLHIGLGVNVAFDKYDADITAGKTVNGAIKTVQTTAVANVTGITDASNLVNGLHGYTASGPATADLVVNNGTNDVIVVNSQGHKKIDSLDTTSNGNSNPVYLYNKTPGDNTTYADLSSGSGLSILTEGAQPANVYQSGTTTDVIASDHSFATSDTAIKVNDVDYYLVTVAATTSTDTPLTLDTTSNGNSNPVYLYNKTPGDNTTYANLSSSSGLSILTEGTQPANVYQSGTTTDVIASGHSFATSDVAIKVNNVDYYPVAVYQNLDVSQITVSNATAATYLLHQSLGRRGTNVGAELKLAYFHDFGNNLMIGVDLTGSISSKNKKNVRVGEFDYKPANLTLTATTETGYPRTIATAKYENGSYTTTVVGTPTISQDDVLDLSSTKADVEAANPGMKITTDASGVNYVTADGTKELAFEKGVFNPRLAFVIGGTVGNWFAGVRTGMSYTTGKVRTSDMTDSKSVSISSPFIGLHVMRQMSDKVHMYITADWNICDGRRTVDMKGIKSFKQSGYNISAGLTWRCRLGN